MVLLQSHWLLAQIGFLSPTPVSGVSFLLDPFANICRTICEFDAPLFAMPQDPDRISIYKGQVPQIQDDLAIFSPRLDERLQFGHVFRIETANQPKYIRSICMSLNP
jgi:hypothetical protein